jgi:hypothetical protein
MRKKKLNKSFNHKITSCAISLALIAVLALSSFAVAEAADAPQNYALIEVRRFHQCSTPEDRITNTPQTFISRSGVFYLNWPDDTHAPIINPNVTLITDSTFSWINGNLPWGYWGNLPPNVTGPPTYMWFWDRNLQEGMEPADAIDIHCGEFESNVFTPGISLERTVAPAVIRGPNAVQRTIVRFRIEQPLPEYVNGISVAIATWEMTEHVSTEFLTAVPTPSVVFRTQDVQWYIPANQLTIGKTYQFMALFRVYNRVGQPVLFKPNVSVGVSYRTLQPLVQGNSVAVTHPDGIRAIVSADNTVTWAVTVTGGYVLELSRVSQIFQR